MFSNFSAFAVTMFGKTRATSEHLYQAMKFIDTNPEVANEIHAALSAHDTKQIAKRYIDKVRPDRHDIKVSIMEKIIQAKYDQHPYIQKKLGETIWYEIIEDSPVDAFWWWWADKQWENNLWKIWMRLRDKIHLHT